MELNSEFLCDWLDPEGFEVIYAENLKQIDHGHYVVQGQQSKRPKSSSERPIDDYGCSLQK